jgi:hypothetical protein
MAICLSGYDGNFLCDIHLALSGNGFFLQKMIQPVKQWRVSEGKWWYHWALGYHVFRHPWYCIDLWWWWMHVALGLS